MRKDNKICGVFMYQLSYTKLTLKVKKEEPKTYNYVLMQFILDEFYQKGFIAKKINKATRNGTKVNFESFEKFGGYEKAKERLFEIGKELDVKLEEGI
jgi:hypothetical protein